MNSVCFSMPGHASLSLAIGFFCTATITTLSAQTPDPVNLLQDTAVRVRGSYTYFTRGNNAGAPIIPFNRSFFPGAPLHGASGEGDGAFIDTGINATSVPFASGKLTDNFTDSRVCGWVNTEDAHGDGSSASHAGTFDLLFDLGAAYLIERIELVYSDTDGHRWTTSGPFATQTVSTAVSFAHRSLEDGDLRLLATQTFSPDVVSATAVFSDGGTRPARYINLRLTATLGSGPNDGATGGHLEEVRVFGYPRPLETALRADDFVETIGVCTHFKSIEVPTTWTSNFSTIKQRLAESGVRHIRDDMPLTASSSDYSRLQSLYLDHGIGTTWVPWTWKRTAPTPAQIVAGLKARPYLEALEGPNEPENAKLFTGVPYTYNGFEDDAAGGSYPGTRTWQTDVYAAIKRDPQTASLPVYAPAMASAGLIQRLLPMHAMDYASMHSYPLGQMPTSGGYAMGGLPSPAGMFQLDSTQMPAVYAMAGNKPLVVTETGYTTALNSDPKRLNKPVSAAAQAKYTPRLYAEYFLRGITATYIYAFVDEGTDLSNQEDYFGWLDHNATPKPVFTAIKTLISLLGEATWQPTSKTWSEPDFAPSALDYTLSGGGVEVHRLLLQKSSGDWFLLLWQEVSSFDTTARQDLSPAAVNVTLSFNIPVSTITVHRLDETSPLVYPGTRSVTVSVRDEITVVRITPSTLAAPWAQTSVGTVGAVGSASPTGSGVFRVSGAGIGTNALGTDDSLHYVYQTAQGDTAVIARVDATTSGIMFRETPDAKSKQAYVSAHSSGKISFQRRTTTGGNSASELTTDTYPLPRWLKLVRSGNTFSAYHSADGDIWAQVGASRTFTLNSTAYAGLAVCSGSSGSTLKTTTFDHISITDSGVPLVALRSADAFGEQSPLDPGRFTLTRTGPATSALPVAYTIGGSAISGTHYTTLSGTVTIPAGANETALLVTPSGLTTARGNRDVVLTLADAVGYKRGMLFSDLVTLRMGGGQIGTFDTGLEGWAAQAVSPPTSTISRVTSPVAAGAGALKWTYVDDDVSTRRYTNEIRLDFPAQDWRTISKVRIRFAEAPGNPSTDFYKDIHYNYHNNGAPVVSGAVGSLQLNLVTGYRTLELSLGNYPRDQVTRFFFFVDGNIFAKGTHVWYIDEITLVDPAGQLVTSNLQSQSADVYQQWKQVNGLPVEIGDTTAPDGDGLPVLLKFATGLTPGVQAVSPLTLSTQPDGRLTLSFQRARPASVNYQVEASSDLQAWTPLASLGAGTDVWTGLTEVSDVFNGNLNTVTVTDDRAVDAQPCRFLRLKVTKP